MEKNPFSTRRDGLHAWALMLSRRLSSLNPIWAFSTAPGFFYCPARVAIHQLLSTNWPAYRSKSGYLRLFDVQTFFLHAFGDFRAVSVAPNSLRPLKKRSLLLKTRLDSTKKGDGGGVVKSLIGILFSHKKYIFRANTEWRQQRWFD